MTTKFPANWKVLLVGYDELETESGDVTSRDGEIIGGWSIVDDVFYTFTPEGEQEDLFFEPYLGMLCNRIAEWHAAKAAF